MFTFLASGGYQRLQYIVCHKCWYHRDTVSSVASAYQGLHLSNNSVCFFRQALALDERRVMFLPEYVNGGISVNQDEGDGADGMPSVKEVWFAGNHSEMCARNISFASLPSFKLISFLQRRE